MKQIGTESLSDDLGEFCAEHGQSLLRFAYLLTSGQGSDAEDLVQTVLTRLTVRGLDGLDDPVAYARRGIVNEHRSLGRHAAVERKVHPRLVSNETLDSPARSDDRLSLFDALGALSERERAAIVLRYYEDLPDEQIAVTLGCLRPTVRSLIHRALPKLRRRLENTDIPPTDSSERGDHE